MDSIQKRSPSGVSLFLAALTLVIAGATSSTKTAAASTPPTAPFIAARSTNAIQLADEITRRLRRIGISFTRTRLPHPYDPAGEVC